MGTNGGQLVYLRDVARVSGFFGNLLQRVILVGVIILLFLGFRSSVIVMIIIPRCILIALALLNATGFAVQQISIAALVIALGLLVDNGIVVVENINEYLRRGFPPLVAAKLLRFRKERKLPLPQRVLNKFVEKVYRPVLDWSLRRGAVVIVVALGMLAGAVSLFPAVGVSFFPTADKPLLLIDIETPPGSGLDATDEAVAFVESIVDTMDYVRDYAANVGHGNPFIYYNRFPRNYNKNIGQVLVNFNEWDPARFYATLRWLRGALGAYAGAEISFQELKNGAPVKAPVEFRISGPDRAVVAGLVDEAERILRATPGILNVRNALLDRKTDVSVDLNRDKAGLIGLSPLDFDQTVLVSLSGLNFDKVSLSDGEEYPLNVRIPFDERPGIEDFDRVFLTTATGAQVPLRQVADLSFTNSPASLSHYNLEPIASLTADVANADQTVQITQTIIDQLDEMDWPTGYGFVAGGEYEDQQAAPSAASSPSS